MALEPWSPFEELAEMRQGMHSAMRQLPGWQLLGPFVDDTGGHFVPAVDVINRGDDLVFRLELPGIDPAKDVNVSVDGRKLHISGQRQPNREEKKDGYYFQGIRYGSFDRTFTLPEDIDESAIVADYKDGVLEVKVVGGAKQVEKPKGKRIPITEAGAAKREKAASSKTVRPTPKKTGGA